MMARKPKHKAHPFFSDPMGKARDFGFGVLRARYGAITNDLADYVGGKLRLCARSELLLPSGVPDLYADPEVCWASLLLPRKFRTGLQRVERSINSRGDL